MATSTAGFDVLVTGRPGVVVLQLTGSIDRSNCETLTHIGHAAMACGAQTVAIDGSALVYVDSALVDTVESLRAAANGRRVVVENLTPFARRLFDICEVPLSDGAVAGDIAGAHAPDRLLGRARRTRGAQGVAGQPGSWSSSLPGLKASRSRSVSVGPPSAGGAPSTR